MSEQVELMSYDDAVSDNEVYSGRSGAVNSSEAPKRTEKYQTYHRRWYMLFSLSFLSLSNGMVMIMVLVYGASYHCSDVVNLCSHSK